MTRVEALLAASESDEVILIDLIRFIASCGRGKFFLVEGYDDVTFLQTKILEVRRELADQVALYNSHGKGNVLKLFEMISESKAIDFNSFWFFVDRDYDDLRGQGPNERIWMTPTYSFENLLVSAAVLEKLLSGEFRCSDAAGVEDAGKIIATFDDFVGSYSVALRYANLCAFYSIRSGRKIHPLDEVVTPSISVDYPIVRLGLSDEEIRSRLPKDGVLDPNDVEALREEFDQLDPVQRWRGKFLIKAFVCLLERLRKDRGAVKNRTIFSARAKMTFDPNHDPVRSLSVVSPAPDCLRTFLHTVP